MKVNNYINTRSNIGIYVSFIDFPCLLQMSFSPIPIWNSLVSNVINLILCFFLSQSVINELREMKEQVAVQFKKESKKVAEITKVSIFQMYSDFQQFEHLKRFQRSHLRVKCFRSGCKENIFTNFYFYWWNGSRSTERNENSRDTSAL